MLYIIRPLTAAFALRRMFRLILLGRFNDSLEFSWPLGLLGVILPSQGMAASLPPRFEANWNAEHLGCYARYYVAPPSAEQFRYCIEDAYQARVSRAHLIRNPAETMRYNSRCRACGITH